MSVQTTDELQEFHRFISEKLRNGAARLSPEEALDEWRDLHPGPEVDDEEFAAIQEAIDDMAKGDRGRDVDEVIAEIRSQCGLPKP